ncbi:MAG TPA: helix-turn-helix domain-containing protein [Thermoanaerobaculia bacterium]|nr:helix-turn-helix domain-containing protein [Thermoanaerobaculia bacterium]
MVRGGAGADFHRDPVKTKKQLIRAAVAEAGGNITRAAARLGPQPTYLHRLIRNLDLRAELEI